MSLNVSTTQIKNCIVVHIQGKILAESDAELLSNAVSKLNSYKLIFEIKELSHINSTGISVFVKTMTQCRIESGDLVICSPNKIISNLFEITKMNDVFSIYDSVESALTYFK
ncbi:MAG: anti-sigma factor antagonist [Crocinitomicaceae bacterium]|jgi:anti-sigma B factor antagonist|tara:strand:- start:33402 stop:33737 length:336 start_codon:yes stop_codon:yes gene_type:complete